MCGIAGWSYPKHRSPPIQSLRRIAYLLAHRGPDGDGFFEDLDAGVALAHRRLSIIDLSSASAQPMRHEQTGVVLSYNGELYNFRELRAELQARGATFATTGDTEVVLKAYLEWGIDCVERFAGMFALAIWDGRSQALHLARDAMGIKPLYWVEHQGGITFGSEAKALAALPGFALALRDAGVAQYLEFGYVIESEATIFQSIKKVPPGERLLIRSGRVVERHAFFTPPHRAVIAPSDAGFASATIALHDLMSTVVAQHLIADVPVAILLSGGLDSSVIAALAAANSVTTTGAGTPIGKPRAIEALTMAFQGASTDERPFAAQVAAHIGANFQQTLIDPIQLLDELENSANTLDDLHADWGTLTTRLLYRKARELGYKVVLVGEGADELFGGYDIFEVPESLGLFAQFRLYQRYSGRRWGHCRGLFSGVFGEYLAATNDAFDAVRLFESRRQLPNQYVMKVDKASMAESVEARAPFLDRRIAEFAYSLPRDYLLRNGENKSVLREVGRTNQLLPPEIASRTKFGAPLDADWMDSNEPLRRCAREKLLDPQSQTRRLGLGRAMQEYLIDGKSGQAWPRALSVYRNLAWKLLLLEYWSESVLGASANANDSPVDQLFPSDGANVATATVPAVTPGGHSAELVTTIIPVFNRPDMLVRAVQSVLDQSYRPIEIIIVDDGSTDDTFAIAQGLEAKHRGVIHAIQQTNAGPGRARQLGVEQARGAYIQFLDSDDRYLPNKTRALVAALQNSPIADIAYGKTLEAFTDGQKRPDTAHRPGERHLKLFPALLGGRIWHANNPLYRASSIRGKVAWPGTRQLEDWHYDALAGAADLSLIYVDEFVAEQWLHGTEHLGHAWRTNAAAHDERIRGLFGVLECAEKAGVRRETDEMQRFCRTLFLEARWAAESGLLDRAGQLLRAARDRATGLRWQYVLFDACAQTLGWKNAARFARWMRK
jgi:asparagine synthase (glutamine-hydrolysing)